MTAPAGLPPGVTVFERGWLSSNNVLFVGRDSTALVDSGYSTHAPQTVALVRTALGGRALDHLLNTHLHSDHCGGNAILQGAYAGLKTRIPPGQLNFVRQWDPVALAYLATGQTCEPFRADGVLTPGDTVELADRDWEIHSSPGHDPHSVVLFEPRSRTLISADSLWQNGFGVVFPELEGNSAFEDVGRTLQLIASLAPITVVPGHGAVFCGEDIVAAALARARSRLEAFVAEPSRHASHAAKVLIKFKLLDWQAIPVIELHAWARQTPYFEIVWRRYFYDLEWSRWISDLTDQLVASRVAARNGELVVNM